MRCAGRPDEHGRKGGGGCSCCGDDSRSSSRSKGKLTDRSTRRPRTEATATFVVLHIAVVGLDICDRLGGMYEGVMGMCVIACWRGKGESTWTNSEGMMHQRRVLELSGDEDDHRNVR